MSDKMTISELIEAGYLVRPSYFAPPLTEIGQEEKPLRDMVADAISSYKKHGKGKKCLVFCKCISDVKKVVDAFNSNGFCFRRVTALMTHNERMTTIEEFKNSGIDGLVSCDCLLDDDFPSVECVIILKKTRSKIENARMIRWPMMKTRKKKESVIFDCVGNYKRLGMLY